MAEDSADSNLSVEDLASRSPGQDEEDPYVDTDVSTLPRWWREAVSMFDEFNLRPYRPPRFQDGTLKHTVQESLEAEFGVEISFVAVNPTYGSDWEIRVDDEPVGTIGRHRSPRGNTVFEMECGEFERFIRSHLA